MSVQSVSRCWKHWFAAFALCTFLSPADVALAADKAAELADVTRMLAAGETPVRIVCFGDSITGVYYHTGSRRAWCDMLGLALEQAYPQAKLEMINAGISGHTTVNGLARIDKDVIAHKPHLVVVMFGMNDVTRVPIDDYEKNVRTIVEKCGAVGAAVVLCTPNSVYENPGRPNAKLRDYSDRVAKIAADRSLKLVDVFAAWQEFRRQDETGWMLLMSDAIHPNMNGHRRFAEVIASQISEKKIELTEVEPPSDGLHNTFDRLHAGEPVKLIAMPPYDALMQEALRAHFPQAKFDVTVWPVDETSVAAYNVWSKRIREAAPNLVVAAIPAAANEATDFAYIDNYEWTLNNCFHFSQRPWDVVPVLPTVAGPVKESEAGRLKLARQIVIGKDVEYIDRQGGDERPAKELVADWVTARWRAWKERSR